MILEGCRQLRNVIYFYLANMKKGEFHLLSITEISKKFNVSLRTIRYYEELGLISKGTRKNGIRYFKVDLIDKEMNEILFLKSLNYKLIEIKKILEHPFFVKELLINMKIFELESSINKKIEERNFFIKLLNKKKWPIADISNNNARYNLKNEYEDIYNYYIKLKKLKKLDEKNLATFFEKYLKWYQSVGVNIDSKHLKYMKQNPEIVNDSFFKYMLTEYKF